MNALKICLARGGKANCCSALGQTALHLATDKGHLQTVFFLSRFYDENFIKMIFMKDNAGQTAKNLASERNDPKIVKVLDDRNESESK